ncbi:TrmH family RNA methyltransferase [Candidatus Saccharibacteria bacterium]|nr:TrmH family RNA methyltransferase [Candidatus Saccharibacteria bacterium]
MQSIVLVVHNVRSAHNVGSILRSADGFGLDHVYLTGYSPYPETKNDTRLPHMVKRATRQISKTALGAENSVKWTHSENVFQLINKLKLDFLVIALEQTPKAKLLTDFKTSNNIALIVGSEVEGLDRQILEIVDLHLKIPMLGQKESFNVAVAAAIAMHYLRTAGAL